MISKNKRLCYGLPVFLFSLYGLSHHMVIIWDACHRGEYRTILNHLFYYYYYFTSSIYRIGSTLAQSFANLGQEIISIAFAVFDKN